MNVEIVINRTGIYGGIKRLYCIAEYLKKAGHNVVVNSADNKKSGWFEHSIQENIPIKADIRICAETHRKLSPTAVNVLYQQAQFDVPEESFDLIVTTTSYLEDFLKRNANIKADYKIPYGFDSKLFIDKLEKRKPNTVAYMPRKNKEEVDLIRQLMPVSKIEFVAIDGMSEKEVINKLQECSVFLALSKDEGFGMPPFEAALCGCLIVGYHGRGGKDWLTNESCVLVKSPQEFPIRIEEALRGLYEERRNKLHQVITEHLTVEKERNAWLNVIQDAIQIHSRRFPPRDSKTS